MLFEVKHSRDFETSRDYRWMQVLKSIFLVWEIIRLIGISVKFFFSQLYFFRLLMGGS